MVVGPSKEPSTPWFRQSGALSRFVSDFITDELRHLRPGGLRVPVLPWPADLPLDEQGIGLDSLERLSIASALTEALHLHESGIEDLLLAQRSFGDWLEVADEGLQAFHARLTFRTSGSNGLPKACTHQTADLLQEVAHLATLIPRARRVLSAVPAHHIYGFLFTVLLPNLWDCHEVIDIRRMTPQAVAKMLQAGDVVVSHPAHWSVFARHVQQVPDGVHGVTSTSPCPDLLAHRLEELGLGTLTQVYGSSETAGIATRTAAGAAFQLMPFWSPDAHDDHRLWRTKADGSLNSHEMQDRVCWEAGHRFRICGRRDEAVQVGGTNVFPARVRQVLLDHPQVTDAAVRLMAPGEGSRLKAFVVSAPGADQEALLTALWEWTETRLTEPERPKSIIFGGQLPRNAMGKLSDWPMETAPRHPLS